MVLVETRGTAPSIGLGSPLEVNPVGFGLKEMIQEARTSVEEVSVQDAHEGLRTGAVHMLIDVREPFEWDKGHISDAVNVPRGLLELRADPESPVTDSELSGNKDARVIVYCTKAPSARSMLAAQTLGRMGYSNVAALRGGLEEWKAAGLPAE
jgi:rhodanese-related sulfurtransferase